MKKPDRWRRTYWVYLLELEHDKWYVAMTADLGKRMKKHFNGQGAEWTQLHKPTRVAFTNRLVCSKAEALKVEAKVYETMVARYGDENVRGASYCLCNKTSRLAPKEKRLERIMEDLDREH